MVRMSADAAIRVSTAAAGLQPASISDEPNVPDVPKVAADTTARVKPVPFEPERPAAVSATVTAVLLYVVTAVSGKSHLHQLR
jgi:hypothetical protein